MKVYDEQGNELTEYDLTKGYLVDSVRLKKNVLPIDNISKFAWYDDDFEPIKVYMKNWEEILPEKSELEKKVERMEKVLTKLEKVVSSLTGKKAL